METLEVRAGRPSASLHYVVGKIDGKLDQMLLMAQGQGEVIGKLGGRVAKLESWQSKLIGSGSAFAFLVTATEVFHVIATHKP
jgi:hypothetical protein